MPSTVPTTVVAKMMFQNTLPAALQSPHAKYICTPNITKMNNTMNTLNGVLRKNEGILLFLLIRDIRRS